MLPDRELDITILEDLDHLAELWNTSETKNSAIRNSVHILRRLLIYSDLQKSANSRKFKIIIDAPDVKPFLKATRYGLIEFFQCGGGNVLGVHIAGTVVHSKRSNRLERIMREHNPDQRVQLNLTSFLRQQVFSFKGEFVTRSDIIKYVANKAGSAHFDRKDRDGTIERIRSAVDIRRTGSGTPSFAFNINAFGTKPLDFTPDPRAIDPVFIEIAATAMFLVESQSVKEYCELLKREYGL